MADRPMEQVSAERAGGLMTASEVDAMSAYEAHLDARMRLIRVAWPG